jgi:hypothetical protein
MSGQIPKGEISFKEWKAKEWFNYLLSQWKIIVLAGIIGAAIGSLFYIKTNLCYLNFNSLALEDKNTDIAA